MAKGLQQEYVSIYAILMIGLGMMAHLRWNQPTFPYVAKWQIVHEWNAPADALSAQRRVTK